jgi:hypothetical protein
MLNDDWIINFEKTDKLYQDFYKEDIYYTNLQFIYINRNNEIEKINKQTFFLSTPNYINREQVIGILKRNSIENDKRYTLLSILRYNITLDIDELKNFILYNNSISSSIDDRFLTKIKNIDVITFEKSIQMFHDLTEVIFIFYEKTNEFKKVDQNNITKRIYFNNNNNKKTIRKQYKD